MTTAGARFPLWQQSSLRLYMHQVRKEMGMSVDAAAKESGYAKNTVNAWERGYLAPDTVQLIGYLQALGYKLCMVPLDSRRPSAAPVDLAAQAQAAE